MEGLLKEIRIAGRSLARSPSFSIAAVITLALGIGANTVIFSAVDGVLLRPLPYPEPDRLAMVWLTNEQEGLDRDITSYPLFADQRERSRTFTALAGFANQSTTIAEGDAPQHVLGALVTGDFFRVLGTGAALGRAIIPSDTLAGNHRVIVLGHGLWSRAFGEDPDVLGRTIPVGTEEHEIVGVMPAGFAYPAAAEFWTPLARTDGMAGLLDSRGALWLSVIGRLEAQVPIHQSEAELEGILRQVAEEQPGTINDGFGMFVEPLRDTIVGDVRPALLLLLGAVGFVLLIACANLANLLLARGAARQRDMAVRAALGASGGRLARQALTESMVLAGVGGLVGITLAVWGTAALVAATPPGIPRIDGVGIHGRVAAVAAGLTLATGLLFGLAPALQARGAVLSAALREAGRGSSSSWVARVRPMLVTGQVAIALVLLVGTGLLVRSLAALQSVDPGFATERVLSFRVIAGEASYPQAGQMRDFHGAFLERIRAMGGVESATSVSTLFLQRLPNMAPIAVEGREGPTEGEQAASVTRDVVDPGFFRAAGIPLGRGRELGPEDVQDGVPVAVVNETFARRYFPGEDPIGRRFTWGDPESDETQWFTIVGVASDTRRSGLAEPVRAEAFLSRIQFPVRPSEYLVRAAGDPAALVPAVRAALAEIDPNLPISQVRTLEGALAESLATRRFVLLLLAGFAGAAIFLAAVGIYGVLSYLVAQRRREVGIRMALGADRRQVVRLVLRQGMTQVLPGVAIGVGGALVLTRLIRSQLFGVGAADPLTFVGVVGVLVAVAVVASWLPARRAAAIEPMDTLRAD